jgi:hypothetical protein
MSNYIEIHPNRSVDGDKRTSSLHLLSIPPLLALLNGHFNHAKVEQIKSKIEMSYYFHPAS